MANSSMLVLPTITAPASSSFSVTVASYGEIKLSSIFEPQLVFTPLVQKMSLCANGMPVNGPAVPALRAPSAACAAASAGAAVTVTKLLSRSSWVLIRCRQARVNSSLEYTPFCRSAASSTRLFWCIKRFLRGSHRVTRPANRDLMDTEPTRRVPALLLNSHEIH